MGGIISIPFRQYNIIVVTGPRPSEIIPPRATWSTYIHFVLGIYGVEGVLGIYGVEGVLGFYGFAPGLR